MCIAHRGGQAEAPENTIEAFRYSLEDCGCDMIELDVWLSKDRELIVVHDNDLSRVCGEEALVSDLTAAALPPVLSSKEIEARGAFFEFYPEFKAFPHPFGRCRIPTLEEVYEAFPDALINVDLKGPYDEAAAAAVIALTRKYRRAKRTVFGGFMQKKLSLIKREMPEAVVAVGPHRVLLLVLAYWLGLLPFLRVWEDVFEFPVSYRYLQREELRLAAERRRALPRALQLFSTDWLALAKAWLLFKLLSNRGFIEALKRRGLLVLGWVVNCEEEYREALDRIGCHGLMTDRPKDLKLFLSKRNHTD